MSLSKLRTQDHYKAVTHELKAAGLGWREEFRGKHVALVVLVNGREEAEILSLTPSDWRAPMKARSHIRRRIREWMAETGTLASAPVPAEFQTLENETMDDNTELASTEAGPIVFERDGRVLANSRDVANLFGRDHKNVLRDVKSLLESGVVPRPTPDRLNSEPIEVWFAPSKYLDARGRQQISYDLTEEGFSLLAMGFTGQKALEFKVAYIKRFKEMQAALQGDVVPSSPEDAMVSILSTMERQVSDINTSLARLSNTLITSEEWGEREKAALVWFGRSLVETLSVNGIGLNKDALEAIAGAAGGASKKVFFNPRNWEQAGLVPVQNGDDHEYRTTFELLTLIIDADKVHSRLTSWVTNEILMPAARDGFWPQGRTPVRSRSDRPSVTFPLLKAKEHLLRKDVRKAVVAKNDGFWRGAQSGVVVGLFDGAARQ